MGRKLLIDKVHIEGIRFFDAYRKNNGYASVEKALKMSPADVVEEILRIDGLDNIEIPTSITITPSVEEDYRAEQFKEKASSVLTGAGFTEILTNSITNSAYFSDEELKTSVKLLNNLSSELNILRPSMLHTALEVISFNINRKNNNLRFF